MALKTRRDELRGRTEYDVARQIVTGVYNVRDAVGWLRSVAVTHAEWAERPGHDPVMSDNSAEGLWRRDGAMPVVSENSTDRFQAAIGATPRDSSS